jgi:calmodulin
LELVGIAQSNLEWLNDVYDQQTHYSTLSEEEFLEFIEKYKGRQHAEYAAAFQECDFDGTGYVEIPELEALMINFGIEPMKHVLTEVVREVDMDGQGSLDLAEFEMLMDLIRARHGFTSRECNDFRSVFQRFDRDRSGEVDVGELYHILGFLGYATSMDKVQAIVNEVDADGTGTINEVEFLICMRKLSDREIALVKDAIFEKDEDGSGTVSMSELDQVLKVLGYFCDSMPIRDAAVAAGLDPDDDELDLSELWRLLTVYRQRDCLSQVDLEEVSSAVNRYSKGEGEVSSFDVGKILRWMGYLTPYEEQQALISRVDVNCSGKLDEEEFRKLVRMLNEPGLIAATDEFNEQAARTKEASHALNERGILTVSSKQAIRLVSCMAMPTGDVAKPEVLIEDVVNIDGEERVPLQGFLRIFDRTKRLARKTFRESGGFSSAELEQFKAEFEALDDDGSGDINNQELSALVERLFPSMAYDKDLRPKLMKLLKESDSDGNGKLEFPDFVVLMRQVKDLEFSERHAKEQTAKDETGFATNEVNEFRDLFLASCKTDSQGLITLDELIDLISAICPMGEKNLKELTAIFTKIASRSAIDDDSADFPEFLRLMRKLLDDNFGQIRERTKVSRVGGSEDATLIE